MSKYNMHATFWSGKAKEMGDIGDLATGDIMLLKFILEK
jgi:hypothetical protein